MFYYGLLSLNTISLQHFSFIDDSLEAKVSEVNASVLSIQYQLWYCSAHSRTLLNTVTREATGHVDIVQRRVTTNHSILIPVVVVVVASPGGLHLQRLECLHPGGHDRPDLLLEPVHVHNV